MKLLSILKKILLENQAIIDKILDKISEKGIESLTPEEKAYLDTGGKSEKPITGNITVYVSEPYSELYKIENFPAVPNAKNVDFKCKDLEDRSTCENYPEMVEMFKNKNFKFVVDKIQNEEESATNNESGYFHGIEFDGDFSSSIDIAYAQVTGDGFLIIVDSLNKFRGMDDEPEEGDNPLWTKSTDTTYQSEKGWGVKRWRKL